jgi:hypothetical protein
VLALWSMEYSSMYFNAVSKDAGIGEGEFIGLGEPPRKMLILLNSFVTLQGKRSRHRSRGMAAFQPPSGQVWLPRMIWF